MMVARSESRGYNVEYSKGKWVYSDTKEPAFDERECRRCGKKPVLLMLKDYHDKTFQEKKIDFCIAPIVKALQDGGIDMVSCCCGHGSRNGWIQLADAKTLIVKKLPSSR